MIDEETPIARGVSHYERVGMDTVLAAEDSIVGDMTDKSGRRASNGENDLQPLVDGEARVDSRYYSIVSDDRTSIATFFTSRSRQTAYSRDSKVSFTSR